MDALFAGYLIRLNYDRKKIDGQFLAYYLNAPSIRQYGYSVMTSSVNQANINGSKLKEYPFIDFDFQTQQKIATHFSQLEFNINNMKQLIEKNIKNYRALVSAILAQELQSEAA